MRFVTRAAVTGIFLLGIVPIALCQDRRGSMDAPKENGSAETAEAGPVRTACKHEIEKFCGGERSAGRCLRQRDSIDLSEACNTALANRGTSSR